MWESADAGAKVPVCLRISGSGAANSPLFVAVKDPSNYFLLALHFSSDNICLGNTTIIKLVIPTGA
jgi:hypothetical protein